MSNWYKLRQYNTCWVETKGVLVELNGKVIHGLDALVGKGEVQIDVALATRERAGDLQTLALVGLKPNLLGADERFRSGIRNLLNC